MRVAILIAPRDFRDETVSKAKGMLEKWGVEPVITSYTSRECVGYHGAVYRPQINAARITPEEFDAILLVDGTGVESYKLYDLMPLLDTLRSFSSRNRIIASVGNAVKIVARANIIANKKVSITNDKEAERLVRLYKGVASENEMEGETNIMSLRDSSKVDELVDLMLDKLGAR